LLIGGNIPGETRVLSIALYDLIESMQMEAANQVAGGLLGFSFLILFLVSYLQKR
jgi:molybdate transport system permease protein